EQLGWLDRLETEHANLCAAVAWCLGPDGDGQAGLRLAHALHTFWVTRSHYAEEGRQYLDLLLASPRAAGRTVARAAALATAASLAFVQSDYTAARTRGQESLAVSEELDDHRGSARTLIFLSTLTSDIEEARTMAERSLAVSREGNNVDGAVAALTRLAQI